MKVWKRTFLTVICVVILATGCQAPQVSVTDQPAAKVFYPPAPDVPRLQFIKSISTAEDLGAEATVGGFEKFILGEDTQKIIDWIAKPYGIALYDGKLYVCDVQKRMVEVLDLKNKTFTYLTKDRRLANPVNICIDKGIKYIADQTGAVFVFGTDDRLKAILGKDLNIKPVDVAVRGNHCYVTDMISNQVVVLDKKTGQEMGRMGKAGDGPGQFGLIADLALDADENVYVTDKALARVTVFDKDGVFRQTFGRIGDNIHDFVRPKGIALDRAGRIWVIDAAPEVAKIYNPEGKLMMFFGFPGLEPGNMNLPASVYIDYDNVDLFNEYFSEGAQIEFLVFVSNQYGQKINIYGFGKFPVEEKRRAAEAAEFSLEPQQTEETEMENEAAEGPE